MKDELSRLQDYWRDEMEAALTYEQLAEAATDPQTRDLLLEMRDTERTTPPAGRPASRNWVGSYPHLHRACGLAGWVCWPGWAGRSESSANWRRWNAGLWLARPGSD